MVSVMDAAANICIFRDKAGAYGIQGSGALLVDRVDGDFYTIVGMPLHRLSIELQKMLCE